MTSTSRGSLLVSFAHPQKRKISISKSSLRLPFSVFLVKEEQREKEDGKTCEEKFSGTNEKEPGKRESVYKTSIYCI